jgi:thiopeptide-type bacteriocin biosynthesis protein
MNRAEPPSLPYRVSDFFALRTPLLPFAEYLHWTRDLRAPLVWEDTEALQIGLMEDRERLRAGLRELISRPTIREALYLASPTLDQSLEHWLDDPDSPRGLQAELVLVRYFQRMTHRCTPFGLFAGHAVGRFGAVSAAKLAHPGQNWRCTRLDQGFLNRLVSHLGTSPALRQEQVLRPNSSLYVIGDTLRYTEFELDDNGYRKYKLVCVQQTDYLRSILEHAAAGTTFRELAAALAAEAETTLEEATDFIHELIDAQVLAVDLEPPITGPDPLGRLAGQLRDCAHTRTAGEILANTAEQMRALDAAGTGQSPARYQAMLRDLQALPVSVDPARAWMVDLFKPAPEFSLGPLVAQELEHCAALAQRITPALETDSLATLRKTFRERYGDRWVPLATALDAETGILLGQGTQDNPDPLLAGFEGLQPKSTDVGWSSREVFLFKRLQSVIASGSQEWSLTDADLSALDAGANASTLPDTIDMTVRLAATSPEAIEQGEFRLQFIGCFGPPGTRLLARFCYGDAQLNEHTQAFLRKEAEYAPEAIFAELVHLPQGRSGNILSRPVLREHELVFLARSGAASDQQIGIADLLLGLVDDRFVLYSIKHAKQVIPRLTSALNFTRTLGISQFLGALTEQQTRNWLGWSWGKLRQEAFLPRVSRGRVVLARATWRVEKRELDPILQHSGPNRFHSIQQWRRDRGLPRLGLLKDDDNELLVDFDNVLSIETFLDLIKSRPYCVLEENYPGPDELAARGPDGGYTHEMVVPLLRIAATPRGAGAPLRAAHQPLAPQQPNRPWPIHVPAQHDPPQENLAPGSDWLYFKLYGGEGTADTILTRAIAPALANWRARAVIDSWFFIRYSDPDPHLRLRIHGQPAILAAEALTGMHEMLAPLLRHGQLWRLELGTYEREINRYGGPENIERAERLFEHDSDAALAIVQACAGDEGAVYRWQLALAGVDRWLRDFGFDLEGRRAFARHARDGYVKEFGADNKTTQGWLSERFRKERKNIELLTLQHVQPSHPIIAAGLQALSTRSAAVTPLIQEMHDLHKRKALSCSLENIAHSLIHMFLNRVLRSAQRLQEMVIYEFLARLYDSERARRNDHSRFTVPS